MILNYIAIRLDMLLEVVLQAAHLLFDTAALQIIKSGECEGKMVSLLLRLITLPSWPCTKPWNLHCWIAKLVTQICTLYSVLLNTSPQYLGARYPIGILFFGILFWRSPWALSFEGLAQGHWDTPLGKTWVKLGSLDLCTCSKFYSLNCTPYTLRILKLYFP